MTDDAGFSPTRAMGEEEAVSDVEIPAFHDEGRSLVPNADSHF
jgi:hypothetical protein